MSHKFEPSILREYDIRGVVGKEVHAADARAIGRSFGTMVRRNGGKRVALGYDGRLSSPELAAACIEGLTAAGIDVTSIGVAATPMLYFAVYHFDTDAGIQITGSHNPPDYNGFKMMMGKKSFFGEQIQKLGAIAGKGDWESGQGKVEQKNILADYAARLLKDVKPGKKLKVAWDIGNGAVGVSIRAVVEKLEGEHFVLNEKVDGTFPAHHPDPTVPKNLEQLMAEVKKQGCDLGIAFDGDGDRIGAIDGKGRVLWGDQLLVLWSRDVLKSHPGATVIADVKASQVLFDEIAKAGGKPMMFKTGHSLIKSKMAEIKAPLAGEMSGHIFFGERWYGFDDATYTAARLLEILSRSKDPSKVLNALPTSFNTPELNVPCAEGEPKVLVQKLLETAKFPGALEVITIDGLRAEYKDGFGLIRSSNTTPVLVMRFEGHTEKALHRIEADFMAALLAVKPDAQIAKAAH